MVCYISIIYSYRISQIIVEVLERMANVTRGVFSKISNFEMQAENMEKYTDLVGNLETQGVERPSKAAVEKARNTCVRVWKSLVLEAPEANQMGALYLTSLAGRRAEKAASVMDLVDEIFDGLELGRKQEYFLVKTQKWADALDTYFEEVTQLITDEVVQGAVADASARAVADEVSNHLRWVAFDHKSFYAYGRMPLFSPTVLTTTISMFTTIGEGLCEVSVPLPRLRIAHIEMYDRCLAGYIRTSDIWCCVLVRIFRRMCRARSCTWYAKIWTRNGRMAIGLWTRYVIRAPDETFERWLN